MPVYDDEKEKIGLNTGQHDDLGVHPEHAEAERDSLDSAYNKPSAPEPDYSDDSNRKSSTPEDLKEAEQTTSKHLPTKPEKSEGDALGEDVLGRGFRDEGRGRRKFTRKQKFAGFGGIMSIVSIVVGLLFGGNALEPIHMIENALSKGNKAPNRALQVRRTRSFTKTIRDINKGSGGVIGRFNADRLVERMSKHGFAIAMEPTTKKINHLSFDYRDVDGSTKTHSFNFDEPDLVKATSDFFDHPVAGKEIKLRYNAVTGGTATTWRGRSAIRLYSKLRVRLQPYTRNAPAETDTSNKTRDNAIAYTKTNIEEAGSGGSINRTRSSSELEDQDGNGEPDSEAIDGTEGFLDPEQEAAISEVLENGESLDEAMGVDSGVGDTFGDGFENAVNDAPNSVSKIQALRNLASKNLIPGINLPKLAARLARFDVALRALDVTEAPRIACRVKGTIDFSQKLKSVYMAAELAKLMTRFATQAHGAKAGSTTARDLGLLMSWLHRPNPTNGKTYANEPSFLKAFLDVGDGKPSNANHARYSLSRKRTGFAAVMYNFVDSVPFTSPLSCKTINNGLVQAGGFAIGIIGAVVSGGGLTTGQLLFQGGLILAEEVSFQLLTSYVLRSVKGGVIDGHENGEQIGAALASGKGSLFGMNGGSNGLKPITKDRAIALINEYDEQERYIASQQTIFDRYFNINEQNSLLRNVAVTMSSTFPRSPKLLLSDGFGILNPSAWADRLASTIPGSGMVIAAGQECDDPQIIEYNIATDAYCNPVMAEAPLLDTDETEAVLRRGINGKPLIDSEGFAIDYPDENYDEDLHDFIEYCHSGRPAILYNDNLTGEGTAEPEDGTCVEPGTPLPGDDVGRFERFTDWCGYMSDRENLIDDINEEFDGKAAFCAQRPGASSANQNTPQPSGNVQSFAQQILDNPNITYPLDNSSPNGSTKEVLQALARGEEAPVTCGNNTTGTGSNTTMNANVLQFILNYGKEARVGVNALTDKCHSANSNHYRGLAVDFECNTVPFDVGRADTIAIPLGGRRNSETCSANRHWHYDF